MADQSKLENFVGSDQLEVVSATVTPSYSVLSFSHRVAKLVCSLTVENGTAEGAIVRLLNLKQVQEGTSVTATSDWKALMVPQTIPAAGFCGSNSSKYGKSFFRVCSCYGFRV